MRRTSPGNPKIAVAYLRVSTDEQKLGPEAQRATIEAWAAREGADVAAWELDQGVSGGTELDDRLGLVRALGELRARKAGVLVVAKRDRLARDTTVAGLIERAVVKCGARVITADGIANGDSPADAFMRAMLDAAAQYERALIGARTKAALAVKRARGERVGRIPLGFTLAPDGVALVPDDREQAVLAQVRVLRATGLSLARIADELTLQGVRPRDAARWYPTQIRRMLRATQTLNSASTPPM